MFESLQSLCENLIAPLVAAQVFLAVLIYFTIVRRRIGAEYKLFICFIITFIIFLLGRSLQYLPFPLPNVYILLTRMFLLFSLGLPSLFVIIVTQSGVTKKTILFKFSYLVGFIVSVLYTAYMGRTRGLFTSLQGYIEPLPFSSLWRTAHIVHISGMMLLLIIPCSYLIIKALREHRNNRLLVFLIGTLFFGIMFVIGTLLRGSFGLYYLASIVTALCWAWAVFQDIRSMSGRVTLLKQEIQLLVSSVDTGIGTDMEKLLDDLQLLSHDNLDVYKMRIHEILCMFTDITIEAGGDAQNLIERNSERTKAIEESSDVKTIREIVRSEAEECREIIAEIPEKRTSELVEKAKSYIDSHFTRDLSVDEIAEAQCLSRSHFMREFKKGSGQTVNQYITTKRIEMAKELLTSKSITDTAFEIGFNNSNYFSTVFKKQTGMTPGQYQDSLKN